MRFKSRELLLSLRTSNLDLLFHDGSRTLRKKSLLFHDGFDGIYSSFGGVDAGYRPTQRQVPCKYVRACVPNLVLRPKHDWRESRLQYVHWHIRHSR